MVESHEGGLYGPPQEVLHITSSHIPWSHLTARHAGKYSLWLGSNFLETDLYSRIEGWREACIFGGQCLYHTTSSYISDSSSYSLHDLVEVTSPF